MIKIKKVKLILAIILLLVTIASANGVILVQHGEGCLGHGKGCRIIMMT